MCNWWRAFGDRDESAVTKALKIWIPGGTGMLGTRLTVDARAGGHHVVATGHDVDIADESMVAKAFTDHAPDVVINCAAYTAVDQAETDVDTAQRLNVDGPHTLACACAAAPNGARLLHVSTDYVFDGTGSTALGETSSTSPLGVYGRTKRDGEVAVLSALPTAQLVRTSWLYGPTHKNFLLTMLRLMAERPQLRVVGDQQGRPTSTATLSAALLALLDHPGDAGIFHVADAVPADEPAPSWHTFASAIQTGAKTRGLPMVTDVVEAITTADYPTPAKRPAWSVLGTHRFEALVGPLPSWRVALAEVLDEVAARR